MAEAIALRGERRPRNQRLHPTVVWQDLAIRQKHADPTVPDSGGFVRAASTLRSCAFVALAAPAFPDVVWG
jgi:hypothetical protein